MASRVMLMSKVINSCNWRFLSGYKFSQTRLGFSTEVSKGDVDSLTEVVYPRVIGKYPPGEWGDMPPKLAWHFHKQAGDLLQYKTAKERLEAIAGSKVYYMTLMRADDPRPNCLEYKKYMTKTSVQKGLPEQYNAMNVENIVKKLRPSIIDSVLLHEKDMNYNINSLDSIHLRESYRSHELLQKLVNCIMSNLSLDYEHLFNSQLDEKVRVETSWQRGGYKNGDELMSVRGNWNGFVSVQFKDRANWQIRTEHPLHEFVPREDDMCKGNSVDCNIPPNSYGQRQISARPTNVSGHWIGDPCEWSLLSFYTHGVFEHNHRSAFDDKTYSSMLHDMAIVAGFGSCASQALNQGFCSFLELTYPITTQTISFSSTGEFYFCAYQLNTIQLFKDDIGNPYQNLAWISGPHKLYHTIENEDVKGFNEETLALLLKFITNTPGDRGINLRPYLPQENAPLHSNKYINYKGEPPIMKPPIGRHQYPKNSVYFQ